MGNKQGVFTSVFTLRPARHQEVSERSSIGVGEDMATPFLARISTPAFVLLCIGTSLLGVGIAFFLAAIAIFQISNNSYNGLIALIPIAIGFIAPIVLLRRQRNKYRRPAQKAPRFEPPLAEASLRESLKQNFVFGDEAHQAKSTPVGPSAATVEGSREAANNSIIWILAFSPVFLTMADIVLAETKIQNAANGNIWIEQLARIAVIGRGSFPIVLPVWFYGLTWTVLCIFDASLLGKSRCRSWFLALSALFLPFLYPFIRAYKLKEAPSYGIVFVFALFFCAALYSAV